MLIVTPLVSVILAVMLIGEAINFRVAVGGALLLFSGIYLETHRKNIKSS